MQNLFRFTTQGYSQGVSFTKALAEFQHVNYMIVRIWEVKRVAWNFIEIPPGYGLDYYTQTSSLLAIVAVTTITSVPCIKQHSKLQASLAGQTSRLVGVVSESKGRLVTYVHIPRSLANIPAKPHSGTHVM